MTKSKVLCSHNTVPGVLSPSTRATLSALPLSWGQECPARQLLSDLEPLFVPHPPGQPVFLWLGPLHGVTVRMAGNEPSADSEWPLPSLLVLVWTKRQHKPLGGPPAEGLTPGCASCNM